MPLHHQSTTHFSDTLSIRNNQALWAPCVIIVLDYTQKNPLSNPPETAFPPVPAVLHEEPRAARVALPVYPLALA